MLSVLTYTTHHYLKPFRQKDDCVVVAHEDGVLRTYKMPLKAEKEDSQKDQMKVSFSLYEVTMIGQFICCLLLFVYLYCISHV